MDYFKEKPDHHHPETHFHPPKPVNALIDKIVFEDLICEEVKNVFKVWQDIQCIDRCFLEICSEDIHTCPHKDAWIVKIHYKLTIIYTTTKCYKRTLTKYLHFEHEIPFPHPCDKPKKDHDNDHDRMCGCDHELDDASKPTSYLFVKAKCDEVTFKNMDRCALIKVKVVFKIKVIITVKKQEYLLTAKHCN